MNSKQIVCSAWLAALWLAWSGATTSWGHGEEPPGPSVDGDFVTDIHCEDGFAHVFPCRNVDLLAWIPNGELPGNRSNDIWGWTDSVTGREYVLLGRNNGVAFVDVSHPTHPEYLGRLPTQTSPSGWRDLKVFADHAFIVSEAFAHGMQVFDLTRLAEVAALPVIFTPDAHYSRFGNAHNIAIDEETGFAYAVGTNSCRGGLHAIDIEDPLTPRFAGCYGGDGYTHDAQCVVYRGPDADYQGREVCFNSNEDTLTIVDVTDKTAPRQLARKGYSGRGYTHQGWLSEDHGYFLLDDELDEYFFGFRSRTYVWDVSDLDAPRLAGKHTGTSTAIDHNLYVRDRHAFEANYTSGLRILRLGDLSRAELGEVAFFDTFPVSDATAFSGAWSVYPFFESGTVAVSDINRGLFLLAPDLAAIPECNDGLDNDADGFVDHREDPSCSGPEGASEFPFNPRVDMDIKPDDEPNPINLVSEGVIPVALFGTEQLDVSDVEGASLSFGPARAPLAHQNGPHREDVDGDGRDDLVAHFHTQETGIAWGDTRTCLRGELIGGPAFAGCDAVVTLPACGLGFELAFLLPPLLWLRRHRKSPRRRAADL